MDFAWPVVHPVVLNTEAPTGCAYYRLFQQSVEEVVLMDRSANRVLSISKDSGLIFGILWYFGRTCILH